MNDKGTQDAPRGFIDETGARRHTMTLKTLQALYKDFENFVADCTQEEYKANKDAITTVYALIHKRINEQFGK